MIKSVLYVISLILISGLTASAQTWKFDFGQGPVKTGYTQVLPSDVYKKAYSADNVTGYFGFEDWKNTKITFLDRGGDDPLQRDIIVGSGMNVPMYFSVNVPEGKYTVTFYIGDPADTANTTIKAESRRLLVQNLRTVAGEFAIRTFTVMRRDPVITSSRKVSLDYTDGREDPAISLGWDRKLTFEFNGPRPCIAGLEIVKVDTGVTLHLCGNSTVVEQEDVPWASWGQMVHVFFNASVIVNNLANTGQTSNGFISSRRLEKICTVIKPGDYLFFEFGHNDSKITGWETTMANTMKVFNDSAASHDATMVFVTPVPRRGDNDSATSVGGSAALVRKTAVSLNAKLIDLNAMGLRLKSALGSKSVMAYGHFVASDLWPDQETINDDTHFSDYGAYEVARCLVQNGLKAAGLPVYRQLLDTTIFNPSVPDDPATWKLGVSLDTVYRHPSGSISIDREGGIGGSIPGHCSFTIRPTTSTIAYTGGHRGSAELVIIGLGGKLIAQMRTMLAEPGGSVCWKELAMLPQGAYLLQTRIDENRSETLTFMVFR